MLQSILSKYPTQDQLKSILEYNPDTGVFTWKKRSESDWDRVALFNSRFAGKEAGSRCSSGGKYYLRINSVFARFPWHAHRLAFIYMTGKMPQHVDHINGNGCDNRWCNLRWSDKRDNARNVRKSKNNTSGHTGVGWNKRQSCWRAYIKIDQKMISLGNHSTIESAIEARHKADIKYGFRNGHGSDRPIY